jgi:hypothetical protein
MAKANPRLEAARKAYREALEAARARPSPESWARLLAAGNELSKAEAPKSRGPRSRRTPELPAGGEVEGVERLE